MGQLRGQQSGGSSEDVYQPTPPNPSLRDKDDGAEYSDGDKDEDEDDESVHEYDYFLFPQLHTSFTYDAGADFLKNDIRVKPDLDAYGALGDAGWYCIRASLWAADYDLPKTVTALREPDFNEAGVILSCGASLWWEDGRIATFYCSFLTNFSMDLTALGTKGYLRVHDFAGPFQENVGTFFIASNSKFGERALGCEPIPGEHIVTTDLPQEALMVTEFATLVNGIKSNGLKPEKKWPTLSRKTQLVLDAVKGSIANGFEPVEIVN
ncbi:uncharacterized oxidoreductase At4g09670-like [Cornus florida]|uniref:uncharacterized oxidoreductase At4g09670-like n=1 Tax=Cornus florida TaxID=4283 RepID=UPI0028A08961|nr:uncharacterized oxidoreductase At4g09670-like [Cornus florida]